MRLEIRSADRIGISQEILAIFSQRSWDLRAIEVATCLTYVHIDQSNLSLAEVSAPLMAVEGVLSCNEIDFLPYQSRENHLQILLARIPDPIIDIDGQGIILTINRAARELLPASSDHIEGLPIDQFFGQPLDSPHKALLTDKPTSTNVTFAGQSYVADSNPVIVANKVSGAVIMLRTMNTLGRQISLMQTRQQQGIDSIIGNSSKIRGVISQSLRYAELDLPVLISGETGTGKELVARAIHHASDRSKAPFLAINCATLPEHLLESELFGYSSGAFTGAQKGGKPGLVEVASGGTLFLDEIAEMSVYLQAKLLRFIQDLGYRRVGSTVELTANVRIISASHENLLTMVEKQQFREDLFYRLNVLNIELPPLRERQEDIALLSQHFIASAAEQVNQSKPKLSAEALVGLGQYHWPGNIRQLQNVLFRLVALSTHPVIEQADLNNVLHQANVSRPRTSQSSQQIGDWANAQAQFEQDLLHQLYPLYPTTRKLAQRLGVSHNKIAMKLRQHGILIR